MQFLSPWMLWGLAALAAPVALHLWQRRRVVQLPFSTLKYLRAVAARTSHSAKLENLLLLLLRCAIFALLAAAAARPAISRKAFQAAGGSVQRTVVFLVDHSMSMNDKQGGQTRLETARAQALAVLDSLKPGDEAAVFAVDDRADPLVALPTLDRPTVRRALETLPAGLGGSNFSAGLIAARRVLAASAKPGKELYLFTDCQATGWQFDPAPVFNDEWKKAVVSLVVVRPDSASAPNAAVVAVKALTPLVTAGERVSGVATVSNRAAAPLHDLLTVTINGQEVTNAPVEVPANGSGDVVFEFQMPTGVTGKAARAVASLQGDSLASDDRFYFSLPLHRMPRVLVVEGAATGPELIHSGFYVRRALAEGNETGTAPAVLAAAGLDEADLTPYSAVFLADVPSLDDRAVIKLDNFARAGGTVVYLPGDLTDLAALGRLDFLPAVAQRVRDLPNGRLSSQITDPDNPLFAGTWSQATPFPPLPQHRLIEWRLKADAQVLVLAGGSEAFVLAGDLGAGRVYIINASPDRAWGDFPLSPAFLPLLQQIALRSAERGLAPEGYTVGQTIPAGPVLPRDQPLVLQFPDGSTQPIRVDDRAVLLDRALQTGFYRVGSAADAELLSFAVNPMAAESDLAPMADAALQKLVPHETVVGVDGLRAWLSQTRGLVPLWPALLLLAALVFAAEAVLSNLAARHRARGDGRQIQTGRLNKRRLASPFRM